MYSLVINKLMKAFMANIARPTATLPHLQTEATAIPNLLWLSWSLLHFSYVTTPLQPNVSTPPLIPPSFIHAGRHPPPPSPTPNNGLPPVIGLSLGLYAKFLCATVLGSHSSALLIHLSVRVMCVMWADARVCVHVCGVCVRVWCVCVHAGVPACSVCVCLCEGEDWCSSSHTAYWHNTSTVNEPCTLYYILHVY